MNAINNQRKIRVNITLSREVNEIVPILLAYETYALSYNRLGSNLRRLNDAIDHTFANDIACDGYYRFNEYIQSERQRDFSFAIKLKLSSLNYVEMLRDTELYSLLYDSVLEYRCGTSSTLNVTKQSTNNGLQLNDHCIVHPLDFILEHWMTFSELITIKRKDPDKILVIIDILTQIMLEDLSWCYNNKQTTYYTMTMTLPTFLNSQTFRELYYPFLYKVGRQVITNGDVLTLFMQRDCSQHYKTLTELPDNKGNIIAITEEQNLKQLKHILGDKMCIGGGLTSNLLDYASEEECEDEVKRFIDQCAPGGGFMLCNPTVLNNISDTNIINLKAAIRVARDYGSD